MKKIQIEIHSSKPDSLESIISVNPDSIDSMALLSNVLASYDCDTLSLRPKSNLVYMELSTMKNINATPKTGTIRPYAQGINLYMTDEGNYISHPRDIDIVNALKEVLYTDVNHNPKVSRIVFDAMTQLVINR